MNEEKTDEAYELLFRLLPLVERACGNTLNGKPCLAPHEWIELDEVLTPLTPGIHAMGDFWRKIAARHEREGYGS